MMRLSQHPVFMCGFRPFFILTAASASLFMLAWLLLLSGVAPVLDGWQPPGGVVAWHAHELVFGFGMAAVAGFLLTAVPEFTGTTPIERRPLAMLVGIWLLGRIAYLLSAWWPDWLGVWPAALANLALAAALLFHLAPPVWRDPQRGHVSFAWALGLLWCLQAGFFVSLARHGDALSWLYAAVGLMMVLIVVAGSRVSMSVVNGFIEEGRPGAPPAGEAGYLARPPRRYLAIFMIGLCSVAEFLLGAGPVTGWIGLAAGAAMLNLLNDWHVGRPLFTRWALMLYASYWLIALGYIVMGLAWLGVPLVPSGGRHLLMVGAMGVSIFTIMSLAGRIHAGQWLDRRPWLPVAVLVLVVAALLRAMAGVPALAQWIPALLMASGLLWAGAFLAYLWHAWPVLSGPRTDGLEGCAEPLEKHAGHAEQDGQKHSCG